MRQESTQFYPCMNWRRKLERNQSYGNFSVSTTDCWLLVMYPRSGDTSPINATLWRYVDTEVDPRRLIQSRVFAASTGRFLRNQNASIEVSLLPQDVSSVVRTPVPRFRC
ncbi:hypothetical protein ElyMa_002745000 [Elysia marginata]|uniref:Uncharacterized protein n=1 Tax=Elysia marginata TaxID=1093978 RepID=A0AAV4HLC3_9GAST|nr:hypothetical protein ElyMa_002745000 [Elysia marginata]